MQPAGSAVAGIFPWAALVAGQRVTFRLMTPDDRERVLAFVRALPEEDLFFLLSDVREQAGMSRWIAGIIDKTAPTVLAEDDHDLLGYGTLRRGVAEWTQHVGEIRVAVAPNQRGKGIGKLLAKEVFAVAHDVGLRRVIARVVSNQTAARSLFQRLGFHLEAVLADCVKDKDGRTYDIVFMSYDELGFHG
jgi:L-amino acid N-acyltransferase YncA